MIMMCRTPCLGAMFLSVLCLLVIGEAAFLPSAAFKSETPTRWRMADGQKQQEISEMRVSEIRNELKELHIDYADCFDKESLVLRLRDARAGNVAQTMTTPAKPKQADGDGTNVYTKTTKTQTATTPTTFLSKDVEAQVRAMSVRDLRQELAQRQIRWADLLEKGDLIRAVLQARLQAANFSVTGKLTPGLVGELTGPELEQEWTYTGDVPLLLDVFATWCGPCHLVAPEVQKVAAVMGDRLRVAKMDSDKHATVSSTLKVQGLPSLILFRNGNEVDRIEGALMKAQIIQWVESKLKT